LTEIGVEKNTTIIFPVPIDLLAGIQKIAGMVPKSTPPASDAPATTEA
jgi:hypothetical protein